MKEVINVTEVSLSTPNWRANESAHLMYAYTRIHCFIVFTVTAGQAHMLPMTLTMALLYSETARQYEEYQNPTTGADKFNSSVILLFARAFPDMSKCLRLKKKVCVPVRYTNLWENTVYLTQPLLVLNDFSWILWRHISVGYTFPRHLCWELSQSTGKKYFE